MLNVIVSTLVQVLLALLIAVAVWLAFGRRKQAFAPFVGLRPAPARTLLIGLALGVVAAPVLLHVPGMIEMAQGAGSVAANLPRKSGLVSMTAILLTAVFKTSFAEELVFRGLIAESLIRRLGFRLGNLLQAAIFGGAHLLLLLIPTASTIAVTALVAFTSATGWLNGWMKDKLAGGSILPGWAAHAAANTIAYSAIAFDCL